MPSKPGPPRDGLARGVGLRHQVLADGLQARGVDEPVQLELADLDRVVAARHLHADAAVLRDGQRCRSGSPRAGLTSGISR